MSPIRDYDRTQELGLTLLGRVPMPASYTHRTTSFTPTITIIFNIYSNTHVVSTLAFYGSIRKSIIFEIIIFSKALFGIFCGFCRLMFAKSYS